MRLKHHASGVVVTVGDGHPAARSPEWERLDAQPKEQEAPPEKSPARPARKRS